MSSEKNPNVAYFCMEYGIDQRFKAYAGGLGLVFVGNKVIPNKKLMPQEMLMIVIIITNMTFWKIPALPLQ